MASPNRSQQKQVTLTVFDNEPTARMAEQRLGQEGIPCVTRVLGGGHGLWGSAYNIPHGLYVYQEDEMRAREVLELTPAEVLEREGYEHQPPSQSRLWLILLAVALSLALITTAPYLWELLR